MPINKIAVSAGQLANWTRFDAHYGIPGAIYKDRSVLLSVPDGFLQVYEQMIAIWNKLGGKGDPMPVNRITRDMFAAEAPQSTPPLGLTDITTGTTTAVVTLKYPDGQAPDAVEVEAIPVTVGLSFFQSFPLAFDPVTGDYPQTVTITGLSSGVQYDFAYQFMYDGGATPGIKTAKVRKSTL